MCLVSTGWVHQAAIWETQTNSQFLENHSNGVYKGDMSGETRAYGNPMSSGQF